MKKFIADESQTNPGSAVFFFNIQITFKSPSLSLQVRINIAIFHSSEEMEANYIFLNK